MECLQFRVDPWAFSFQGISYNDDDELWPMFNSYIYIGPVCVCRSLSLIYFSGNFSPAFNLNVHLNYTSYVHQTEIEIMSGFIYQF